MSRILVINPGSTSTKIAVYENEQALFSENIVHADEELSACATLFDQLPMRNAAVRRALEAHAVDPDTLSGVVGRGGMIPGLHTGAYAVNGVMKDVITSGKLITHASNLGALMADAAAAPLKIPAIIYDAVSSDDMQDIAKITGFPEVKRESFCHVLNTRAVGRRYAEENGKSYEDLSLIVAHLGGGISISAHRGGKIIDVISDDGGPFSPERAGSTNILYIIDMCFSGQYTKKEIVRKQRGNGGLKAWLGTADCREIERRIAAGDELAAKVYDAQAYQIAKGIGNLAPVLNCRLDAIILTGGIAHSAMLTEKIAGYVQAMAPVVVMPGEFEMEALALGMLRVLRGEEPMQTYAGLPE